jgi:transcriptional regulator with XRE-family HTH domain
MTLISLRPTLCLCIMAHMPSAALDPLVQQILDVRKRQDLTQEALSASSGVSRRAIAHMEAGGDVTLSTLRRLCQALNVELQVADPAADTVSGRRKRPTLDDVTEEHRQERFGPRERGG